MAKPKVVITRKIPAEAEERARGLFDVELNASDTPLGATGLARAMREADGLLPLGSGATGAEQGGGRGGNDEMPTLDGHCLSLLLRGPVLLAADLLSWTTPDRAPIISSSAGSRRAARWR